MKGYREAAVLAAKLLHDQKFNDPADAWKAAARTGFRSSQSLQEKGCPKAAFLGLCNQGLIVDVPPLPNAKASKNGQYAIKAAETLKQNKILASQPELLWKKVAGNTKSHNHQMDVVIGLWEANMIR